MSRGMKQSRAHPTLRLQEIFISCSKTKGREGPATEKLPEFRWDPKYQATVLTASSPNAYPGAETLLPDKLSLDHMYFHYTLQQ